MWKRTEHRRTYEDSRRSSLGLKAESPSKTNVAFKYEAISNRYNKTMTQADDEGKKCQLKARAYARFQKGNDRSLRRPVGRARTEILRARALRSFSYINRVMKKYI